jgi:ATP-dependent helicase HrpB
MKMIWRFAHINLSFAGRVVQITRDLAGFWKTPYPEVKKDLMDRYG